MILDQPIDPNYINGLSEEEKIRLAKQAYTEFAQLIESISEEQKEKLAQILDQVEAQKISEIKELINQF